MKVLVNLTNGNLGLLFRNVPKVDFTIHGATRQNYRISGMERHLSQTIWNLNRSGWFSLVQISSEYGPDAEHRQMLAPSCVVGFTIGDRETGPVTIPAETCDLIIVISSGKLFLWLLVGISLLNFRFWVIPVIKVLILILRRCIDTLTHLVKCLLNGFIGFLKVKIGPQAISLIDVFAFFYPKRLVWVEYICDDICLQDSRKPGVNLF